MEGEIVNKVAQSGIITLSLEDFYPQGPRKTIDLKDFLWEGMLLKEKHFRDLIGNYPWEELQHSFVNVICSEDAIIPQWAYMMIAQKLSGIAKRVVFGTSEQLESLLYDEIISNLDTTPYQDKRIILKGCSNLPVPAHAFSAMAFKLTPVVKSLMYGEACSAVPIYKKK